MTSGMDSLISPAFINSNVSRLMFPVKICNAAKLIFELDKISRILAAMIVGVNHHCQTQLFQGIRCVKFLKLELILRRNLIGLILPG